MTRQLKISDLFYFKEKTKNKHITLETDKNSKEMHIFLYNLLFDIITLNK